MAPPEIFNTDQGCQFTSEAFTGMLKAHGIAISMDDVEGHWTTSLWSDSGVASARRRVSERLHHDARIAAGLTKYFEFYNTERTHQSLGYSTPDVVYRTASGGGASIVDKFSERKKLTQEQNTETNRGSAVPLHVKVTLLNSMLYCLD